MKDLTINPPFMVKSANGSYIIDDHDRKIIDGISSWWCKNMGHRHPRIVQALHQQLDQFEHVMFGNTTHNSVIELSEKLTHLTPTLHKIAFASDGSCAVEMALKMSLHARQITGETQRTTFMALENSYHGDTGLAMSVSDLGIYRLPYAAVLPHVPFLKGIPYVSSKHDPLWHDCSSVWPALEQQLNQYADHLTAIIVEPLVQGAGGMLIYAKDFLIRLRKWTQQHHVHLIADEIMTGFYRTGLTLACDYAAIEPDFLCLGKGLTNGVLPLSLTLTSNAIYDLFYDDIEKGKTFYHSHTHSGNALATAAALACLTAFEDEHIAQRVPLLETKLFSFMQEVANQTGCLTNIRYIGGIVAAELINHHHIPRFGYRVGQEAIKRGALLRPIMNTVYWAPPLNIDDDTLIKLRDITCEAIKAAFIYTQSE
ncbi:MAG: adenosylmethionine--8-amino-7-oxononanoate transaminase [Gammaproteobacteria bacterium]